MKLQMNDSNRTIITSFDTEVKFYHTHEEGRQGYLGIIEINGLKLRYEGKDYSKATKKDFQKLITKGAIKQYEPPYIDEQEKAHWEAVAADCANPALHGHVIATTLAGENSGCLVWDWNLQKGVAKEDLSPAPVNPCKIIKTRNTSNDMKDLGIYPNSIYKVENNKIINERGEPLNIQWWLLDYEYLNS